PAPAAACPPSGATKAALLELKEKNFEIASAEQRNRLAIQLLPCLETADPKIRDGVAFEALSTWMRAKALTTATVLTIGESLERTLAGEKDAGGFRLPFAALTLAEVARADRIEPILTDAARAEMVDLAATSLLRVDDYRGFDAVDGWRHGVAHGADLVLQLGINPKVGPDGVRRLMDAVRSQVAPAGRVSYIFGEPARFARAIVFTYRRNVVDAAYWDGWFKSIADPRPFASWGKAAGSLEGLAKRHNTLSFLNAVAFVSRSLGDDAGRTLAALADKTASQLSGS
ncbi:MAG: DUF2785 domain-containing protein, partial [Vicinamibacteria bacterium]